MNYTRTKFLHYLLLLNVSLTRSIEVSNFGVQRVPTIFFSDDIQKLSFQLSIKERFQFMNYFRPLFFSSSGYHDNQN